jgi:hypothetical protein
MELEVETLLPSDEIDGSAAAPAARYTNRRRGSFMTCPLAAPKLFQFAVPLKEAVISAYGIVSRVTPVHTAVRNYTRDEGGPFEVGNQVLISSHRKLLSSKAMVVNVAEKSKRDFGRYD